MKDFLPAWNIFFLPLSSVWRKKVEWCESIFLFRHQITAIAAAMTPAAFPANGVLELLVTTAFARSRASAGNEHT